MQRKAGEESEKRATGLAEEIEPPTPKPSTAGLYTARMYSPLIFVKIEGFSFKYCSLVNYFEYCSLLNSHLTHLH